MGLIAGVSGRLFDLPVRPRARWAMPGWTEFHGWLFAEPWRIALVALALFALLQTLRLWWHAAAPGRRARDRNARAMLGERAAEDLLLSLGYQIVARQARTPWSVQVDSHREQFELRADFLVKRRGRRFVAEVKTGRTAPTVRAPATRRQLLEYRIAYDVDGVLLVDMERASVRRVRFPGLSLPYSERPE